MHNSAAANDEPLACLIGTREGAKVGVQRKILTTKPLPSRPLVVHPLGIPASVVCWPMVKPLWMEIRPRSGL